MLQELFQEMYSVYADNLYTHRLQEFPEKTTPSMLRNRLYGSILSRGCTLQLVEYLFRPIKYVIVLETLRYE